ncbi:cupin domain-containing protein [Candidatus Cetobacterium colombiensis]|jgi:quercetin dioxygenase-like cupin family protein|uniref:Cupin domain-containing protein n=1 Tax=Candidatus Cetobacterium colombiensis TaxID=3073100 RepID=A0ABU4WBX6_9FUSO|nr:cupin domain-containing protein [Candidatus Cetobacterium colombiensis]MDX8336189.1 cupin domain-containing protein [Candidatus Cetobacterium colombiensis]
MKAIKNIEFNKIMNLEKIVPYGDKTINSLMVALKNSLNMTIFSFDENEMLSEHSAPADALVYILDGELEISINKIKHNVKKGQMILMPANILHALKALKKSKMLLIIVKKQEDLGGFINLNYSKEIQMKDILVGFEGGVVSKRIIDLKDLTSLMFAMSENQEIEHNQTEGELFILNLDGELDIIIGDNQELMKKDDIIVIPPNVLYQIKAKTDSKFILIEIN